MTQVKTYGTGRKTEAQKIADAERKKEKAQIKERERQETLQAAADADIQKAAAEIVLAREEGRSVDAAKLGTEVQTSLDERAADRERLDELMEESDKGKAMFYRFMKSAINVALRDMDRSQEVARLAVRLGVSNPLTAGVMGVGQASGVIQDKVRFVEAILKRFAKRYRAIGHISAEDFESPVGT